MTKCLLLPKLVEQPGF